MSETDHQATTVLLPAASVAVFSHDKDTIKTAGSLASDWRFARVKIDALPGDVDTAIAAYESKGSPDLIIIQTDTTDEAFTAKLEKLAGHLSEGTAAIVVGPENDVYLYRRLIEMGVSDYLVKPLKTEMLSQVIAKTLLSQGGTSGSRLIALIGSKGGVGVTVLSQALAWGAADLLGEKTLLLDAAGGWSSMGVGMGYEPSATLAQAARAAINNDEDSLKRMIFKASDKLSVLSGSGDNLLEHAISPAHIEQILSMVMTKHPVVLVDLSAATPEVQNAVITRANEIIVVATPSLPALRLARSLIQEIRDARGGNADGIELVLNMQGMSPSVEVPKADIQKAMEITPSVIVPYNAKLFARHESEGKKIIDDKEGRIVVQSLLPLLKKSVSASLPVEADVKKSMLGGILKKGKKG